MKLLIDIRTPYQNKIVDELISSHVLDDFSDIYYLIPKNIYYKFDETKKAKSFVYNGSPSKYELILYYFFLALKLRIYLKGTEVKILTALNHGPLFYALTSILGSRILLYEDGISTFLKLRNRMSLRRREKFLRAGNFETAYVNKNASFLIDEKLSKTVKYYQVDSSYSGKKSKINVFVSSSSVEYGLETISKYKDRLGKLRLELTDHPLLVSFHHNEKRWQEKKDIIFSLFNSINVVDRDTPLESVIRNYKLVHFIAPYNTTALNVIRQYECEKFVFFDDNGPNMLERKKLFLNISSKHKIEHIK